jgi:adenylate cyclase
LYSDLRGFTAAAEATPPEQLVEQLNAYLYEMVRCIEGEGGVIDKYMGDGIMAVFGAPRAREDDAARALRAARAMQTALERHNQARALKALPPLEHGIGVHYGNAIAGHVGTPAHAQYTVVGDVVNVASRIERLTKEHHKGVLVSGELVARAAAADPTRGLSRVGTVEVRGRTQPIELYSVEA